MHTQVAINYFDGKATNLVTAMAEAGYPISKGAVSQWGKLVPELQARRLEEITGGELTFDPALYEHTPVKKAS
jgi:hypothetical protein